MDLKIFFTELKRRNVYKVAVAYADRAWNPLRRDPRFQDLCERKRP